MGLKEARIQITNRFGETENTILTVRKFNDLDLWLGGQVGMGVYENEQQRQRLANKDIWFIEVSAEEIQAAMMQQGLVAFVISDAIWEIARTQKFIPDWEWFEEEGKANGYVLKMKSLDDLGVTPTEL